MSSYLCKHCNSIKPLDLFVKSKSTKSGYRGICKDCFNAYYRKRRVEKWDLVRSYEKKFHFQRRLKHEYNITEQEFNKLKQEQNSKCAICFNEEKLVIDHCHTNGNVRGLLCSKCNIGLGMFKDDKQRLQNALDYLRKKYD